MIQVKRDNGKVTIEVETGLAFDCAGTKITTLAFEWNVAHPYLADVLRRYVKKLLSDAISKTRQEYYEAGWRDAKSKQKKADWFSGEL